MFNDSTKFEINKYFPDHFNDLCNAMGCMRAYFDTSAVNYLIEDCAPDEIAITREYLNSVKKIWYISPVNLTEIMLTQEELKMDKKVFFSQQLFSPRLLASPAEICTRYIEHAYPENKVNYSFFSSSDLADLWMRMCRDYSIKFLYNRDDLLRRVSLIRKLSKNTGYVLSGDITHTDEEVNAITHVAEVGLKFYKDKNPTADKKYDERNRAVILYLLLILVCKADLCSQCIDSFWKKYGVDDPMKESIPELLFFLIDRFPDLFFLGPFAEMAMMTVYQNQDIKKKDRGVIFDSMHMIYAPYVNMLASHDISFSGHRKNIPIYSQKVYHVSEMKLFKIPFKSSRLIK